jgi:hypothetical protein
MNPDEYILWMVTWNVCNSYYNVMWTRLYLNSTKFLCEILRYWYCDNILCSCPCRRYANIHNCKKLVSSAACTVEDNIRTLTCCSASIVLCIHNFISIYLLFIYLYICMNQELDFMLHTRKGMFFQVNFRFMCVEQMQIHILYALFICDNI